MGKPKVTMVPCFHASEPLAPRRAVAEVIQAFADNNWILTWQDDLYACVLVCDFTYVGGERTDPLCGAPIEAHLLLDLDTDVVWKIRFHSKVEGALELVNEQIGSWFEGGELEVTASEFGIFSRDVTQAGNHLEPSYVREPADSTESKE
jgi:hypothetical protein